MDTAESNKLFQNILRSDVQEYLHKNLSADLPSFLLKKSPFTDITVQQLAQQLKGMQVAQRKMPFLNVPGIIFPPGLNLEQSSSEATANYKASLVKGENFADLTSGFGVDAFFISMNFENTTLVEQNAELLQTVSHNWKVLGKQAVFVHSDLKDFLVANNKKFGLVFLDPARRDINKRKVFLLEDLSPDILEIQDALLDISDKIMVKLSPLIDITYVADVIKNLAEIHIVAVRNDVKELLLLIEKEATAEILVKAVNLETEEENFNYNLTHSSPPAELSDPLKYLYIPNNAVLKTGAFNIITERFGLKKLHPNTHFYTSGELVDSFPGRILEVKEISSREIKKGSSFNIISKNYPLKPAEIKKKYKITDGGSSYLIFCTSVSGKIILKSVD